MKLGDKIGTLLKEKGLNRDEITPSVEIAKKWQMPWRFLLIM
jgi:hypothetical protein